MRRTLTGLATAVVLAGAGSGLAVAGSGLAGAKATPADASGWRYQHVMLPSGARTGFLSAVSCPSGSDCVAAGGYTTSGSDGLPLAEHWTGHAWSPQSVPVPGGTVQASLYAMSCATATRCLSVGSYLGNGYGEALSEQMNGRTWTAQTTIPLPASGKGGYLDGVSCVAANDCTAVGNYGATVGDKPMAEHWNGQAWTLEPVPDPGNSPSAGLGGISCSSAGSCVAVGSYAVHNGSKNQTFAAMWNGKAWTLVNVPLPAAAARYGGTLAAVFCLSAADCTAVGNYSPKQSDVDYRTLAERWNGHTWTVEATPDPGTGSALADSLTGVSCSSADSCTAVGAQTENGSNGHPLAEYWNGSSWAAQRTAPDKQDEALAGVTCVSATTCTAVGSYAQGKASNLLPLAEQN
jgi:hypothetical protein